MKIAVTSSAIEILDHPFESLIKKICRKVLNTWLKMSRLGHYSEKEGREEEEKREAE